MAAKRSAEPEQYMTVSILEIDKELRPASLMRVTLDQQAVAEYADLLDDLPPVQLRYDPEYKIHWVEDGAHTITACRERGRHAIEARVVAGTYRQAFEAACKANAKRGVRLTNADKRARVESARKEWPQLSQRDLAAVCNVSQSFVGKLDREAGEHGIHVGRDGKTYQARRSSKNGQSEPLPSGPDRAARPSPAHEPEPDVASHAVVEEQCGPPAELQDTKPSTEEWLATLDRRANLAQSPLEQFDRDAKLYHAIREAGLARRLAAVASPFFSEAEGRPEGPFLRLVKRLVRGQHPRGWLLCGDCFGKGCDSCYHAGYRA
jgi:hypothetical protein